MRRLLRDPQGQMALEALIALIIIALVVGVMFTVSIGNNSLANDTQMSDRALYIAKRNLEAAKARSRDNFSSVISSSTAEGAYQNELVIESVDSYTKRVTSRVNWNLFSFRPQKVELLTLFTDLQSALSGGLSGGGSGGSGVSGDWRNPSTLSTLDLGPGNEGTDVVVRNRMVYMTGVAASQNKPDFFVIDATTPTQPILKLSLDTGPGLNAVKISGSYAYVAQNNAATQLQIIRIDDVRNPSVTASHSLGGVGAAGKSIFVSDDRAYVGTGENSGVEFKIVNVADPANPVDLGGYEVGAAVNNIYVRSGIAYLATNRNDAEVIALDVDNPQSIAPLGFLDLAGTQDGLSVFLVATTTKRLYIGRSDGSNAQLSIADVTNPAAMMELGSVNVSGHVNDLVVRDNLGFLATSNSNQEFQAWDLSNPTSPSQWSFFNFPQNGTGIDYENNLVYMSVRSNDALRIITSGN